MNQEPLYHPKIYIFIYTDNSSDECEVSFHLFNGDSYQIDQNKIYPLNKNKTITLYVLDYTKNNNSVHHICIKQKGSTSEYNINSTIMEIWTNSTSNPVKFEFDISLFKNTQINKALFKFATSKLNVIKPEDALMHFLFNIQPNGKILSSTELLDYSREFIMWLPSFIQKHLLSSKNLTDDQILIYRKFYSEYLFFIYRKFWQSQIFGATSLIFALYQQKFRDEKHISDYVTKKIEKNNFFLPIDLEFSNMKFAKDNLDLISENMITCDNVYLAFLAGYQVSLHSQFYEITSEWMADVKDSKETGINIKHFAEIYCKRIKATLMGREFKKFIDQGDQVQKCITTPHAVIQKFNEFASLFVGNKLTDAINEIKLQIDGVYITEDLVSTIKFTTSQNNSIK